MKKTILLFLLLPLLASGQYFDVFDIDTSEYPIMKAKFYSIDADGKQILNHTPADFEITENGEPRDVISVSCPKQKEDPFSVVIAIDISSSMTGTNIDMAKEAIKSLIELIPNNESEVCIIGFNHKNFYISDFTSNKSKLKLKLENLTVEGGTDFNAALIDPIAGALLAMEKAKNINKRIILVTDGAATGNENDITKKAIELNSQIIPIVIGTKAPQILENLASRTNGRLYEEITTNYHFKNIFLKEVIEARFEPCELIWNSTIDCKNYLDIVIKKKSQPKEFSTYIELNNGQFAFIDTKVFFINFYNISPVSSKDTTLYLTAKNEDFIITSATFNPTNQYELIENLPLEIKKDKTVELNIRFNSIDSISRYSKLKLSTNKCDDIEIGLINSFKDKLINTKSIVLTHPNGGEIFNAGSDTVITWEGIAMNDSVSLKFSANNGKDWSLINNKSTNYKENWIVPNINSDSCLIEVNQFSKTSLQEKDIEFEVSIPVLKIPTSAEELEDEYKGEALSICENKNGGYTFTAISVYIDSWKDNDVRGTSLIKLTKDGLIEWSSLTGDFYDAYYGYSIHELPNNDIVVAGKRKTKDKVTNKATGTDGFIFKTDEKGELIWKKIVGGSDIDEITSMQVLNDGGYILIGHTYSKELLVDSNDNSPDIWVIKLDSYGEEIWSKSFGSLNSGDFAKSIIQTFDGGFILTGHVNNDIIQGNPLNGKSDILILKLDPDGKIEWDEYYGTQENDFGNSIIQLEDGSFIIGGSTKDNDEKDFLILKLNPNGKFEWVKTLGGSKEDYIYSVLNSKQSTFYVSGNVSRSNGDIPEIGNNRNYPGQWAFEMDSKGEILWSKSFTSIFPRSTMHQMIKSTDDGLLFVGSYFFFDDYKDFNSRLKKDNTNMWIVKLAGPPQPLQSDTSDAVFSIIMPEPVIQNNDIDMGQMIVGSTKDTIVSSVICNVGDAPLHVLGVDITGGDTGDFLIPRGAGDFYLEKDSCQDMMFEFTPSALGNRSVVATIRTTIGDFKDTIHIRGVGINPVIEATAEVLDFGVFELGEGKDTTVVLVKNVGTNDITITNTRISGPDMEQFSLLTSPVSYTIPAGQEEMFELNYTAKFGGRTSSILEFHYDGIGSPLRSMLFAEGVGGEVYPEVPDAYVGETVDLGLFLGKIKPEGLSEIATNFTATVSYNSTLLAPIDKSINISTVEDKSFISITGQLSGVPQIASIPMKVGLGTADKSGLVITEFQLYDANGDSVDYDIEPGVGEFNVLGICEEGGQRLLNPDGEATLLKLLPNRTSGHTTVEMTLIESGQTELTIFDQIGNKIETIYSGNPDIGTQEIALDLSNYSNGRYYIKLTTPTITKTEILEVVR